MHVVSSVCVSFWSCSISVKHWGPIKASKRDAHEVRTGCSTKLCYCWFISNLDFATNCHPHLSVSSFSAFSLLCKATWESNTQLALFKNTLIFVTSALQTELQLCPRSGYTDRWYPPISRRVAPGNPAAEEHSPCRAVEMLGIKPRVSSTFGLSYICLLTAVSHTNHGNHNPDWTQSFFHFFRCPHGRPSTARWIAL